MTAYFPGGTQQWTLLPFRWWWYFIANWSYWVPQWGTIRVDSSPGALNIELYGMSAGDDVSGPTGDTEFPWGTMRVDFSSGAINIEQYDVCWWQYFRGSLVILNSPGALNIKQRPWGRFFNVWVRYFVWNFKGNLWNSTQNIFPMHWKISFSYKIEILRALRIKSS